MGQLQKRTLLGSVKLLRKRTLLRSVKQLQERTLLRSLKIPSRWRSTWVASHIQYSAPLKSGLCLKCLRTFVDAGKQKDKSKRQVGKTSKYEEKARASS